MDENLSGSEWDDFNITQDFQGTVIDLKKVSKHLRQAFPDDKFEIEIQFETYSLLQEFEKKLQVEYEILNPEQRIVDTNDFDYLFRHIYDKALKKERDDWDKCKSYKVMFPSPLKLTVFCHYYEKAINIMEKQYNYRILPYRKNFIVYLKDPHQEKISSFFITEIIELKNKLRMYIESDQQIFAKAKYSKKAVEKLEKMNIQTMIVSRYMSAVFYSQCFSTVYEMQKQVRKALSYHVSVVKFPQNYIDRYILQEIVKLIYFEIKPTLKEIQKSYEMPVQIDIQKAAIVITDYHEVFTDGLLLLVDSLSKIKIIQIQCNSMVELKKILLKSQYASVMKFNYRYRKCFLLFSDSNTEKYIKILDKFCAQIANHLRSHYKLTIHCVQLFKDRAKCQSEMQRLYLIAAEYQLQSLVYHKFTNCKDFNLIVIEPKQLGVYSENYRQKQIKGFLYDFISNKPAPKQEFKNYSIFQDTMQEESVFIEANRQNSIFVEQPSFTNLNKREQNRKMYQSFSSKFTQNKEELNEINFPKNSKGAQFLILNIPLEYPLQEPIDQNQPFKRGKRQRVLQTLFQGQWRRKLRIWKIIVKSCIELPIINSYQKIELVLPKMFQLNNKGYTLKKYTEVDSKSAKDFKQGQTGYVSFINRRKNIFIPLYEVGFIG